MRELRRRPGGERTIKSATSHSGWASRSGFHGSYVFLGPSLRADPQQVTYALNFGERDNRPPLVEGKLLYFSAYVWHFTDWAFLARFLKARLGALGVDWISEESMDPFSLLDP